MDVKKKGNPWALWPFLLFIVLFLGAGLVTGDFYKFPVIVAIIISGIAALALNRKEPIQKKIDVFAKGAGSGNVMLMVIIFLLAGAFSEVAKGVGAVDSTVQFALSIIPSSFLVVGLFIIACFISLSMGTSVGTIVALAPIALGVSEQTDLTAAFTVASVIGGAMFGDNLSFISDTTIASVRTQGTEMKDKFKINVWIALPAAVITCIVLAILGFGHQANIDLHTYNGIKILPYIIVLLLAIIGVNVFIVLTVGIVCAGAIGVMDGSYHLMDVLQKANEGIAGMYEISFLAILIAGMVEVIRFNGGIDYLLHIVTKRIRTKKGAEWSIASLVGLTDFATANNTISIMIVGPLAKNIADQYHVDPRRSASILDIFSCCVQGIIPYGAQLLAAAGIAGISPVMLLPYSFYPVILAICGGIAIFIGFPRAKKASL